MKSSSNCLRCVLALMVLGAVALLPIASQGQTTTAFTYQGRLTQSGTAASGSFDLQFKLFDAVTSGTQIGSTLTQSSVSVANGLFNVSLDFGSSSFPAADRWLEIAVTPAGSGSYETISPRTKLNPAPFAIRAAASDAYTGSVSDSQLSANVTKLNATQTFTGVNTFSGTVLNGVTSLGGALQSTGGNTRGANAIDLQVSRSESTAIASGTASVLSGGQDNRAVGNYSVVGGGYQNANSGAYSTIAGGDRNGIQSGYTNSTIAGGSQNLIGEHNATIAGGVRNSAGATASTIGGGVDNNIGGIYSVIGGGFTNRVNSEYGVVAGGSGNQILSGGYNAIGGGSANLAPGQYATVPGGLSNTAGGAYSFAAGRRANAAHHGSFVWGDSTDADVTSQGQDTFVVRASGGVLIYANVTTSGTVTANGVLLTSDRNSKENFASVDGRRILESLSSIPIQTWNFKSQDSSIRHLGPMAQDFASAFKVGEDDKHINAVDSAGVALAAIQGLHQLVKEKDAKIESLEKRVAELDSLKERLAELEKVVSSLTRK